MNKAKQAQNIEYGLIKYKGSALPTTDLLVVPHKESDLIVKVFGPDTYKDNLSKMKGHYSHSSERLGNLTDITFKPLPTYFSLAVASYDFPNLAKPMIFNSNWLQAGRILRVAEGVWINPLEDKGGEVITDEKELEKYLHTQNKMVNGIYLLDGHTSFVPYNSFEKREQCPEKFLEGGLARGLVHTSEKIADSLSPIANDKEYPNNVDVLGFDSVKEPILKVVCLYFYRDVGCGGLVVDGSGWIDDYYGYAFGGLVSCRASTKI
ncbi:hypothetical protein COU54_05040 [Candidatus Pacearchaeota archaeon CG10_big_fil_rev_8_21_14_0_10_31_24]|nr:MAG: hypothetical protein COU54_05040 [Candidatus Pacearchaeota archaeon CG10_big_fil_rev_8_21_14_0_10_31_24]